MRRALLIAASVLAVLLGLLILSQLLVPPYLEHRAEKRLTKHGGHATVSIDALPAFRLLFDDGDKIKVRGNGLHVQLLSPQGQVFSELDRFAQADVRLTRMSAGPFAVRRVVLSRADWSRPYSLVVDASVTARALSSYAGSQLGGPFGGLLGRLASGLLPFSTEPIPVELDAAIRSRNGRAELQAVNGSVAGLPAGPFAAALAAAIAGRF